MVSKLLYSYLPRNQTSWDKVRVRKMEFIGLKRKNRKAFSRVRGKPVNLLPPHHTGTQGTGSLPSARGTNFRGSTPSSQCAGLWEVLQRALKVGCLSASLQKEWRLGGEGDGASVQKVVACQKEVARQYRRRWRVGAKGGGVLVQKEVARGCWRRWHIGEEEWASPSRKCQFKPWFLMTFQELFVYYFFLSLFFLTNLFSRPRFILCPGVFTSWCLLIKKHS